MTAGRKSLSLKKDWGTPQKYVSAVKEMFYGTIDLDPCSNEFSIVHAQTEYLYPDKDGLVENWNFKTIYMNPPYGRDSEKKTTIKHWLAKCVQAHEMFDSEILALVPVAPNTVHWKRFIFTKATGICFLYDTRLKFLENGNNIGKGAPMACAMIYWGHNYLRFYEVFIKHGAVVDISHLIGESISKDRLSLTLELTH
jgi:hypothetical protein